MEIQLTQGKVCLIDDEDWERVKGYKYNLIGHFPNWYVRLYHSGKDRTGSVSLHRLLLNAPDGVDVDHMNGNGLDNRRSNLRLCTRQQNLANSRLRNVPKASKFKGVSWDKSRSLWFSQITVNYIHMNLGRFSSEDDAALAYNQAAQAAWGAFARLNEVAYEANNSRHTREVGNPQTTLEG